MMAVPVAESTELRPGDTVVLAEGPYEGMPGVFLSLQEDIHWAEIKHWNGVVQTHPVAWRRRSDPWAGESRVEARPAEAA